jgi:hypothetical protein
MLPLPGLLPVPGSDKVKLSAPGSVEQSTPLETVQVQPQS